MTIGYYERFISTELLEHLRSVSRPVQGVKGLSEVGNGGGLESKESFQFLCECYLAMKESLNSVLNERDSARRFIDERTAACYELNRKLKTDFLDADYSTLLGHMDAQGEIVLGPKSKSFCLPGGGQPIAGVPTYLMGPHVTLFGPPDSAKMSINAMNAFHRKLEGEPAIVAELLAGSPYSPMWGADDEDSKTPLREDLVQAGINLSGCFDRTLHFVDPETKKEYRLASERLSLPIKRFPGLALPSLFLLYEGSPIPLHLYDFALHLYKNWNQPSSLVFYVPKLETESEARYIKSMVETAEKLLQKRFPSYKMGTVRLLIVLENPRAIFRVNEMMDVLHPYFVGASLGWHDFLSSTARLFKNDANYRIPVKADPDIVIKYIKASHQLLADVVGSRGGIKIGGMYGVLPIDTDLKSASFQVTMKGFIRDVVTQFKRDLTGFWVAHPDFVRIGLALVEAWRHFKSGDKSKIETLVKGLLVPSHQAEILQFIHAGDVASLDKTSPLFPRSLIVADIKESNYIPNNHPAEIRYNVFQALQYLTDWLSGNGCVALPAQIDGVPVRVMDDLATAERSRWEVWHEVHHQRLPVEDLIKIAHEEMLFIRKDASDSKKIVQVKWNDRTAKWYPIAHQLMLQLMTSENPVEFASELLLPFTIDSVRHSTDPWMSVKKLTPKYELTPYVQSLDTYFHICGSLKFAVPMANTLIPDLELAERLIRAFSLKELIEAASFHGDIGESKRSLDATAAKEQGGVQEALRKNLLELGSNYKEKFGVKFLISAKGKSGEEIEEELKRRLKGSPKEELDNQRNALWEITRKRLLELPRSSLQGKIKDNLRKNKVHSAQISVASGKDRLQTLALETKGNVLFELASLSKTVATCFALEYFSKKSISIDTSVNSLFSKTRSSFRLKSSSAPHPAWADAVTVRHLLNHTALNMHYVNGIPADKALPKIETWLESVQVLHSPGTVFTYSGAGFLVLEHLLESMEGKTCVELTEPFLRALGLETLTFDPKTRPGSEYATGFLGDGTKVEGSRKMFPSFAAGAMGGSDAMLRFLAHLTNAYQLIQGSGSISHATAVQMFHSVDKGSRQFMGAGMGLGVFIVEADENRFAVHQGANDGFRCLYAYCFKGPDRHKGFVVLCNADTNGVAFVAETAQLLLTELRISGIDTSKFLTAFQSSGIAPEQLVNQGYKALLFDAFKADLPEVISPKGSADPLAEYNLAVGATVLEVSNQRFARAENLISAHLPTFDPEAYDRQGKTMDSWETVRHNSSEYDYLTIRLKKTSPILFISFSTEFHLGNHAPMVLLQGRENATSPWKEIVPKTALEGHSALRVKSHDTKTVFSEINVCIFPDGGLTRLGLFGDDLPEKEQARFQPSEKARCERFQTPIPHPLKPMVPTYSATPDAIQKNWARIHKGEEVDVASAAYGAKIVSVSNEHYGPAAQVISPYPALHMFDGFESARSREPGHQESVEIQFGRPANLHRLEFDFRYFRHNNPVSLSVEGLAGKHWIPIVPQTGVKAYAGNTISFPVFAAEPIEAIRVAVFPDGGINRIRAFATLTGRESSDIFVNGV